MTLFFLRGLLKRFGHNDEDGQYGDGDGVAQIERCLIEGADVGVSTPQTHRAPRRRDKVLASKSISIFQPTYKSKLPGRDCYRRACARQSALVSGQHSIAVSPSPPVIFSVFARPHKSHLPAGLPSHSLCISLIMPEGYDYLFKLLLIGDSGVGKVRVDTIM